jgi:hypothetical protein
MSERIYCKLFALLRTAWATRSAFTAAWTVGFEVIMVLTCISVRADTAKQPVLSSGVGTTQRKLHFPGDKSLGALFVGNERAVLGRYENLSQVANATGDVTIKVPKGSRVLFEANRRIFEDPSCLDKISPVGIDSIKMGFMSMDDREDDMCNKALAHLSKLSGLTSIDIDRSDATDAGVSQLRGCTSLEGLSCSMSAVKGTFFKDLESLKSLRGLWIANCLIDQKNMVYLSHFPNLKELDIERTQLNSDGAKFLARCSSLESLVVRGNAKFDDNCLQYLLPLKNLSSLDLRETPVTMKGLRTLKLPKLRSIGLPHSLSKNLPELRRMFPSVRIDVVSPYDSNTEDAQIYYRPLR